MMRSHNIIRHILNLEATATVRFAHIDSAGVVFYPRYFELLARNFPQLDIVSAPMLLETNFAQPSRLGDRITMNLSRETESTEWTVSGIVDRAEQFTIKWNSSGGEQLRADAHQSVLNAFRVEFGRIGSWAMDTSARLSLSKYYELVNETTEEWIGSVTEVQFCVFLNELGFGIPTARLTTRSRRCPELGEDLAMWLYVEKLGAKSIRLRHCLVSQNICLMETVQIIVLVDSKSTTIRSVPIPKDWRSRMLCTNS